MFEDCLYVTKKKIDKIFYSCVNYDEEFYIKK
jgi:hypothetical protein